MAHNPQIPAISLVIEHKFFVSMNNARTRCLDWMARALLASQTARMISVLTSMSDQQLAQIGITRTQIPEYAAMLMEHEHS